MASYFSELELRCKHCGENKIKPGFLRQLNDLRDVWGKPLTLTSAYRCPVHNRSKAVNGAEDSRHVHGDAADISWAHMSGIQKAELLQRALQRFTGIGISQAFLHVDSRPGPQLLWVYGSKTKETI